MRSIASAALVIALATGAAAQEGPPERAPPASAAEGDAAPPPTAPAGAGQQSASEAEETARIVFFRPSRLTGAIYTYHIVEVGDDGKKSKESPRLGALPNGGAFVYEAPAGVHSFNITGPMAVNLNEDRLRMEVEPGETYYVEQTVRMGVITGGFRLTPADEARFVKSKAKLEKGKASAAAEPDAR